VADAARSILDGHIVLTRKLATLGQFPAIDTLQSASRVRDDVIVEGHRKAANQVQRLLAAYREKEDLIAIGAYQAGTEPVVDTAIRMRPELLGFLQQGSDEYTPYDETRQRLLALADAAAGPTRV
jgi:flagellar biosynthesis/type III secretory pathway ATPase